MFLGPITHMEASHRLNIPEPAAYYDLLVT